jgi:hypothetical protein
VFPELVPPVLPHEPLDEQVPPAQHVDEPLGQQ